MTAAPRTSTPAPAAAVMAQAARENFPVASRLLPRAQRAHLLALYGVTRLIDDLGDEGPPQERLARLDWAEAELDRVYGDGEPEHPLMRRLVPTVRACALPREPFARLIEAGRQDQRVHSYATAEELLAYCRLSAAPVGELVLHVFGRATEDRIRLSDRICAGLQIAEHLQDVGEDHARGRIYLPLEDLAVAGCTDDDLRAPASPPFRAAMALVTARARRLFNEGTPLVRRLPPRAAIAVAGFVGGGHAALDAIERAGGDVLGGRPRPTPRMVAIRSLRTLAGGGR